MLDRQLIGAQFILALIGVSAGLGYVKAQCYGGPCGRIRKAMRISCQATGKDGWRCQTCGRYGTGFQQPTAAEFET